MAIAIACSFRQAVAIAIRILDYFNMLCYTVLVKFVQPSLSNLEAICEQQSNTKYSGLPVVQCET